MISLWCMKYVNIGVVLAFILIDFKHNTGLPFVFSYSKKRNLKLGFDWAYICCTVSLWKASSVPYSATCSVGDWLFPPRPSSRWRKEQSLNLLLSASHLDHKNSCSEHANQYPPILCSSRPGFTAIAFHKDQGRARSVLSYWVTCS